MSRNSRTIRTCGRCGERVLRSERFDHPHDVGFPDWNEPREEPSSDTSEDADDEEESEYDISDEYLVNGKPMEVGGTYTIRLSYSIDYSFNVTANSEDQAVQQAKEMVNYGNAVDAMHLHTDKTKHGTIYADDDAAEEHDLLW